MASIRRIGVAAMGGSAVDIVNRIEDFERRGIPAAWLTTGGAGLDGLSLFAAAAVRTERILMGTCIIPTFPRHPIVAVQQVQVIAQLAPGRLRLGLGPSHRPMMEGMYGFDFKKPLTNLREYVHIVKTLLREGAVKFEGFHYRVDATVPHPITDVPIMASALSLGSYEFCGEATDGAISWVSPYDYLRDQAIPAIKRGAGKAGRDAPPMIAHVPLCVHDDPAEVRVAASEQLNNYTRLPFYVGMFTKAGFEEAGGGWSQRMVDTVVVSGSETQVADRLRRLFDDGIGEVLVTIMPAGADRKASTERSLRFLAEAAGKV